MNDPSRTSGVSRVEIAIALLLVSAIIWCSYLVAHDVNVNTASDPQFRRPVQHIYGGLLFQGIAWILLFAAILPKRAQDFLVAFPLMPSRLSLCVPVLWTLLVAVMMYHEASTTLQAASLRPFFSR